jgi:hypothetical protein
MSKASPAQAQATEVRLITAVNNNEQIAWRAATTRLRNSQVMRSISKRAVGESAAEMAPENGRPRAANR